MQDTGLPFEVEKSVDPRLVQKQQVFSAITGASAINNVSIGASSNSNTVLTYSVIPPSAGVVIQGAPLLDLVLTTDVQVIQTPVMYPGTGTACTYTLVNGAPTATQGYTPGVPLCLVGRDVALARAYPLGQIVSSYNISLNNTAVQQQNASLPDLAHLTETPGSRAGRGTTSRVPKFASWDDAYGTAWSLDAAQGDAQGFGDVGPGAYELVYTDASGTPLVGNNMYKDARGTWVPYVNGVPYTCANNANVGTLAAPAFPTGPQPALGTTGTIGVYIQMRLIDPVMCSPFGFSFEDTYRRCGLYGISSMLVNATLTDAASARLFQNCTVNGCVMALVPQNQQLIPMAQNGGGIRKASIWNTYLSPSITSTLPPRSILPLCNIQYFQQTFNFDPVVNTSYYTQPPVKTITFSAVTFPCIPDAFVVSLRPLASQQLPSEADWCCTFPDQAVQQFTFANQSGLFAGWSALSLAMMSRDNGSRASLADYGGAGGSGWTRQGGMPRQTGGSVLVIRPGKDFPLPTGTAVGSTGQCQLTFQLNFNAFGLQNASRSYVCTVTALMSAYFITEDGVSRPIQVGLDEAAVLAAPEGPDRYMTSKLVGGNFFSTLASFAPKLVHRVVQHAPEIMGTAAQAAHAISTGNPMAGLGAAKGAFGLGRKLFGQGYSAAGLSGAGMYPSDVSDVGMDYGQQNAGSKRGRLSDRL